MPDPFHPLRQDSLNEETPAQSQMPLVDALLRASASEKDSWHMPGHRGGKAWPSWLTDSLASLDLTAPETPAALMRFVIDVLRRAGFGAVSVDTGLLGESADEALGARWDAGGVVVLGEVPSADDPRLRPEVVARRVAALWSRIGFGIAAVGQRTWLSPSCGLAGASPQWAREVAGLMRAATRMLEAGEYPGRRVSVGAGSLRA